MYLCLQIYSKEVVDSFTVKINKSTRLINRNKFEYIEIDVVNFLFHVQWELGNKHPFTYNAHPLTPYLINVNLQNRLVD